MTSGLVPAELRRLCRHARLHAGLQEYSPLQPRDSFNGQGMAGIELVHWETAAKVVVGRRTGQEEVTSSTQRIQWQDVAGLIPSHSVFLFFFTEQHKRCNRLKEVRARLEEIFLWPRTYPSPLIKPRIILLASLLYLIQPDFSFAFIYRGWRSSAIWPSWMWQNNGCSRACFSSPPALHISQSVS